MYKLYKVDFPSVYITAQSDEDAEDFLNSELNDCPFVSDLENYTLSPVTKEDDIKYDTIDTEEYLPYGQPDGMEMSAKQLLKVSKLVKDLSNEQLVLLKDLLKHE